MFVARAVAAAAGGFNPSGMFKNGGQVVPNTTWTQITAWTADTGTYPGSTITSDGLNAQAAKTGATLTANIVYTIGGTALSAQVRIKVNGTVVVTGTASGSTSGGTATATTTQNLSNGDNVTVEVSFGAFTQSSNNITSGTGTYLRIT